MKKLLVVGVIVLFIGLAFAPSINANISKASVDNELVEITTEVCGLKGGKHTVSLSKDDALEIEQLFDSIKERLDIVKTREETEEIFKDAIVELDKYGLLGGLSVEQAQRLVTGQFQNQRMMKIFEEIIGRQKRPLDVNENFLCLTAGKVDGSDFFFFNILHNIMWRQLLIVLLSIFGLGAFIVMVMMMPIYFFMIAIDYLNPICIGRIIRSTDRCSGTVVTSVAPSTRFFSLIKLL